MASTSGSSAAVWMKRSTEVWKLSYGWWSSTSPSRITSKMLRGVGQARRRDRMERRILAAPGGRATRACSRSAVSISPASRTGRRRERPGRRILLLAELHQQQLAERRRHRGVHLDPHHLGEAPVAHLFLDQAQQIFGLVTVIDLEVGVAGDPEGVPPEDLDAGEQRLQVGADDLLQRHERVGRRQRHPARQDLGHLDPREPLLAVGAAQHHGQREAEVRDVRERMARIDRERREHRKHVGLEIARRRAPGPAAADRPDR